MSQWPRQRTHVCENEINKGHGKEKSRNPKQRASGIGKPLLQAETCCKPSRPSAHPPSYPQSPISQRVSSSPQAYIALSSVKDEAGFLFGIACGLTACALFALGAIKSRFSTQKWYTSGFWVLLNGSLAAGAAYLVGFLYVSWGKGAQHTDRTRGSDPWGMLE